MFTAKEVSKSVAYAYFSAPNKLNSRILIVVPYYFTITIIAIDLPIHYLCKWYCYWVYLRFQNYTLHLTIIFFLTCRVCLVKSSWICRYLPLKTLGGNERELIATPSMGVWEKQALPITTILYHNFTDIVACAYASWA